MNEKTDSVIDTVRYFLKRSVYNVRKQSYLTGSLYCLCNLALMHCAGTCGTTGKDLSAL